MNDDENYSFTESLKEFLGESSLHGIRFLSSTKNSSIRRVVWVLLILASLVLFGLVASRFISDLYSMKINTKIKVFSANELTFPTITICNKNIWRKDKINQSSIEFNNDSSLFEIFKDLYSIHPTEQHLTSDKYDRNNTNSSYMPELSSSQMEQFFSKIAHEVSLQICYLERSLVPCNNLFKVVKTDGGYCSQFNSKGNLSVTAAGSSGSLRFFTDIQTDLYSIGPDSYSEGILIAITEAGEVPLVTKLGIGAPGGTEMYINIEKTEISRQPPPADGNTSQCFDTTSLPNPLQYYTQYSYSACQIECETRYVISQCGCREVLQPALENATACTLRQMVYCSRNARKDFPSDPDGLRSCHCPDTCSHTKYSAEVSNFHFPSQSYIEQLGYSEETVKLLERDWILVEIFFGKMSYIRLEEEIAFDWLDAVAYIGGTLGLCVGASTLTLFEFLEFLIISAVKSYTLQIKKSLSEEKYCSVSGEGNKLKGLTKFIEMKQSANTE